MSIKKVFKSRSPSVCYVFGYQTKKIQFIQGRYFTDIQEEIDELTREIKLGHSMFYIDPNECELDTEAEAKRIQELKDQTIAEYLATQAKLQKGDTDMGTTETAPIMPVGTNKMAQLIAGSTSGASAPTPTK